MFTSSSWWNLGTSDPPGRSAPEQDPQTQVENEMSGVTVSGSPGQAGWDDSSTPISTEASEETGSDELSGEEESDMEDMQWKEWFLSLPGNDFLVNVQDEFIEDEFNLTGLPSLVPYYSDAIDVILENAMGMTFVNILVTP
jgi:hypothetical protein